MASIFTGSTVNIVFIDPTIPDYQSLLAGADSGDEIVILDPTRDGIAQIGQALVGRSVNSIHIISHGTPGSIQLGTARVDSDSIQTTYKAALQQWSNSLVPGGDILLYGCNVAQGNAGLAFVQQFSQITGADIAASDNATGSLVLGGDWNLEVTTGSIEAPLAFQTAVLEAYNSVLAPFTAGDIVVLRVGDGSAALSSAATAVFLDEYNLSGSRVQSIALPTTVNGSNARLTQSGTAGSEGALNLSADGRYLTLVGYDAATGTASITGTASATTNRIVARVDASGSVDTSTRINNAYTANNIRSAVTNDGSGFWVSGPATGLTYVPFGSTGGSTTLNGLNSRVTNIFTGQLYTSSGSGSNIGVNTVGTGLPTSGTQTVNLLPGLPNTGNPYAYVLLDRDAGVAGLDTLYIADQTAGLLKYSFNGTTWTARGSIAGTLTGLTGTINATGGVDLFGTNGTSAGNTLFRFNDSNAFNANLSGSFTTLATAGTNTLFRGVAFAPTSAAPVLPDLTISQTDSPDPVVVGNTLTYTLTVGNSGTANASGITVQYTLPAGVTFNSTNVGTSGFSASQPDANGAITFSGGSINANSSATLAIAIIPTTSGTLNSGTAIVDPNNTIAESNENNNTAAAITTTVNPVVISNTAPTIQINTTATTNFLDGGATATPASGNFYISGVASDPTDPASQQGLVFTIADAETAASGLIVNATSSNTAVVANGNLTFSGTGSDRTLKILPTGVGYANVTVTVSDGSLSSSYTVNYAASAAGTTTSRFLTGAANASTAIAIDANYMLVGDDENQVLRLYDRNNSGLPINGFDHTSLLGLTDLKNGVPREVDIEASVRNGNRIFWLGSESNNDSGTARPNRDRIFATDNAGTGASTTLSYAGRYDFLREDIIAWDVNNLHGKGANYYGLAASAAAGVSSKINSGYNIEGLEFAPDNTTAYVAFRAPQEPTATRTTALIVPVTNFTSLLSATGVGVQGSATFGAPIELDLGGRGIREIRKNANNQYVIIAGPAGDATGVAPADFQLYTWTGNASDAPVQRSANLTALNAGGSFESIVEVPATLTSTTQLQLLVDNGSTVFYNDSLAGSDLTVPNFQKSRSEIVTLGSPIARIHDIQGTAHLSPLVGQSVGNVPGIVTAVATNGFYFQDPNPDNDDRTSEGIFVFTSSAPTVAVGDSLLVSGTVTEFRPGGSANNLTVTEITSPSITRLSSGNALPAAVILGNGGRTIPTTIIENDTTNVETNGIFDPAQDGIDFYESLEGMLVQINNPVTTSPTAFFGSSEEIWVLADNGANATSRTARGGSLITATDFNPERIQIDDLVNSLTLPTVDVGAQLSTITGVVNYDFNNYEVLVPTAPTVVQASPLQREVTTLTGDANQLTVATFNVQNLDPGDGAAKFAGLAYAIVNNLKSPDILNLEEIQDNNGATNNGVVDASVTYQMLINAIVASGGPTYQYRQIDPVDGTNGGEPGGNIRVGFLFNSSRVSFVDRPGGTSTSSTTVTNTAGNPTLSASPGLIDPTNSAFNSSRKPLVGEFTFNGQIVYVIGNHFNSKGGDQPLFGPNQPPTLSSEVQRNQQATIVKNFVQSILAIDPKANIVVAGDLNDFEFSNPLTILEGGGLNTLIETLPANERYTYNFQGNAQVLDQILVSNNLLTNLAGFDVVHINSEFATQVSDHDPSVARFNLTAPDTTPPVTPTVTLTSDTGISSSDRITQIGTLTLTNIEANALVQYSIDGTTWTNSFTAVQGVNTVQVRQTDAAGNVSPVTALTFTLDTVAPTAPSVALTSDTGVSSTDGITRIGTLAITGTEANTLVEYSINGGTTWTSSFTAVQGANTIQVRQTDVAGNVSSVTPLTFTLDTVAPTAPSVSLTSDTGTSSTDGITQVGTLAITSIEANAVVEYSINGGTTWATSFTAVQGANTVQVRQTDVAGNVSAATPLTFTLDTIAPTAPSVALTSDTGVSSTDGITRIGTLAVTSTEANALVEYSINGGTTWTTSFTAVQGANTVQVRQTDVAGNVSSVTPLSFTLDTVATAPVVALTSDTGTSSTDGITQVGTLAITGTEANALVEYSTNGTTWTNSFTAVQGANTVQVRQTDVAGNISPVTALSFTLDTITPTALGVALTSDTGASNSDRITQVGTLAITGTEANALVEYSTNGGTTWATSFTAVQGANTVQVRQTDVAGNVSLVTPLTFTLDTIAPTAPNVALTSDTGASNSDLITQIGTIAVTGTEANAVVEYSINGGTTWTSGFTAAQGANTVQVRQTDVAGNVSTPTTLAFTLDTTVVAPTLALAVDSGISNNDKLTNSGVVNVNGLETGASWQYSTNSGTSWIAGAGNSLTLTGDGAKTVVVQQTDLAGNVSGISAPLTFTLDTVAPTKTVTIASMTKDTGTSTTDFITNDGTAGRTYSGTLSVALVAASENLQVSVDGGTTWGLATVNNTSWSFVDNTAKTGNWTVLARVADTAGNAAPTASRSVTLDLLVPAASSVILDLTAASDSGVSNTDNLTNVARPTFAIAFDSNRAQVGDTVQVMNSNNIIFGSATLTAAQVSAGSANLTLAAATPLIGGLNTLSVMYRDVAGNSVTSASTLDVTYDNQISAASAVTLDLLATSDSGVSNTDNLTNITLPTFAVTFDSAKTQVGDVIEVRRGSTVLGTTTLNAAQAAAGTVDVTLTTALNNGANTLSAVHRDAAGNTVTGTATLVVTRDTIAPNAPIATGYTLANVNGTVEANAIVQFSTSASSPTSFVGSATAASGNYNLDTTSLAGSSAGTTYYLYAQDVAGNLGTASSQRVVVGTAGDDLFANVGGSGSDLLIGNSGTDTAQYAVASNAISLTGQINSANGSVNIRTANIDVLTGIEQLNFTGTGYTGLGTGANQLRSSIQSALGNNSVAEFNGVYESLSGNFSFGVGNPNATLLVFDSNPGSAQNYEAFLLLGKTTFSGSIGLAAGTVSLTNL